MKLASIEIRNFRSIGDLDFRFNDGVYALVGENGVGKSSILMSVDAALFGSRKIRWGQDDMSLTLTFDHAGSTWRVRRSLKRGGNVKLDLEVMVDDTWETRTQGTAKDTQAYLISLIGFTRPVFRACFYLAQNESDSFAGALPAERKRIFAESLNLGWAAKGSKVAGEERGAAEKRLATVAASVDGLAERALQADALATEAEDLRVVIDVAEAGASESLALAEKHTAEAADLTERERQHAIRSSAVTAARAENDAHLEKLKRSDTARTQRDAAQTELDQLEAEDLDQLEQERARLDQQATDARERRDALAQAQAGRDSAAGRVAEHQDLARQLDRRAAELAATIEAKRADDHATCTTCGQHVADESKAKMIAELERLSTECETSKDANLKEAQKAMDLVVDADRLIAEAAKHPVPAPDAAAYNALVDRIKAARAVETHAAGLRERIRNCDAAIAETNTDEFRETARHLAFSLAEAERSLAEIPPLVPGAATTAAANASLAKQVADQHAQRGRTASERLAVVTTLLEQAQAALVEHAAAVTERDRLLHEIDVLAGIEKALGRDGLPAWIVEKKIPEFEAVTNDYLRRLGATPSRIELRNERESQAGKKSESLDIICHSDDGEAAIEDFSGGEQYRGHLALAFGMRHVVAGAGGADLRYLALDEPEGLDAKGKEALADILREIVANGVSTALLTSHDPGLRDSFDQSISVERGPAGSTVTL